MPCHLTPDAHEWVNKSQEEKQRTKGLIYDSQRSSHLISVTNELDTLQGQRLALDTIPDVEKARKRQTIKPTAYKTRFSALTLHIILYGQPYCSSLRNAKQ